MKKKQKSYNNRKRVIKIIDRKGKWNVHHRNIVPLRRFKIEVACSLFHHSPKTSPCLQLPSPLICHLSSSSAEQSLSLPIPISGIWFQWNTLLLRSTWPQEPFTSLVTPHHNMLPRDHHQFRFLFIYLSVNDRIMISCFMF